MKRIPLANSHTPYRWTLPHQEQIPIMERRYVYFEMDAYRSGDSGPPSVMVIRNRPENQGGLLMSNLPHLAEWLSRRAGLHGFTATYIAHFPEAAPGNQPFEYFKADLRYEGPPGAGRPILHYHSKALDPEDVARIIGQENMPPVHRTITAPEPKTSPPLEHGERATNLTLATLPTAGIHRSIYLLAHQAVTNEAAQTQSATVSEAPGTPHAPTQEVQPTHDQGGIDLD